MDRQDAVTTAVIRWALSSPVLSWRLAIVAGEVASNGDMDQELMCTVADLLDPERNAMWRGYLLASGADPCEADATWKQLGGISGIYAVCWARVREALLSVGQPGSMAE